MQEAKKFILDGPCLNTRTLLESQIRISSYVRAGTRFKSALKQSLSKWAIYWSKYNILLEYKNYTACSELEYLQ